MDQKRCWSVPVQRCVKIKETMKNRNRETRAEYETRTMEQNKLEQDGIKKIHSVQLFVIMVQSVCL